MNHNLKAEHYKVLRSSWIYNVSRTWHTWMSVPHVQHLKPGLCTIGLLQHQWFLSLLTNPFFFCKISPQTYPLSTAIGYWEVFKYHDTWLLLDGNSTEGLFLPLSLPSSLQCEDEGGPDPNLKAYYINKKHNAIPHRNKLSFHIKIF